jgi:glycosidase
MKTAIRHRLLSFVATLLFWLLASFPAQANPYPPNRVKPGAVIYGVVPPLFGTGFRDITSRLDELQELGVDIIWLSPINSTNDDSIISYAVTDHFSIRDDFGTLEELKRLVSEAHRRGLKVIMDFVPNHTSRGHPYYLDIQDKGEASPYYDFYDRDEAGRITHYFDWDHLPNLNLKKPRVLSMIEGAFRHWMVETGIDGYRVDAAWGVRERAPDVWGYLIRELRSHNRDIIMLAEAGARDPYYEDHGFDLAYDWSEKIGEWAWKKAFDRPQETGRILYETLNEFREASDTVARFLNNNDTGLRFISRYGPAVTRPAAVLQHMVPGVPMLYTGDEVGAEYEPYEDPDPISWEDRHGLREHYRRLADLREKLPAIHSGGFISLPLQGSSAAYGFIRLVDEKNWALVLVNFGPAAQLELNLPPGFAQRLSGPVHDALSGKTMSPQVDPAGVLKLNLASFESLILIPSIN